MDAEAKQRLRVLRFLASGAAETGASARPGSVLLETADRGAMALPAALVATMVSEGLVTRSATGLAITAAGSAHLRRSMAAVDSFAGQHRDLETRAVEMDGARRAVEVNLAESPLAQLARHKARDGRPFLAASEIEAGERLRADFTRGQMMPRMGANWIASVASGRRAGGIQDLTDAALSARIRAERALESVGPELAGVLADVCCFLKGLELVETERGWPVRSAKVVLKAALGALARHYEPPRRGVSAAKRPLHWGAEGFRPSIGTGE